MIIKADLTGEKFETVSFYDGKTIFFDATTILPSTVSFKVWGAGLMPDFDWESYIDTDEDTNLKSILNSSQGVEVTNQGFGTLTLTNVFSGKVSICPYDGKDFLRNKKGDRVELIREWSPEFANENCSEYNFDTTIYFPYGACSLQLFTKGSVTLEFNTQDCIKYIDYITNPKREDSFWGYLTNSNLTTNSYRYEDFE